MDERTALEAMAAGDETALGWFIGRYAAYAATIINNMLLPRLSEADAEEALADVFVSLWRSAARIRPEGVRTYIAAIARNRALDALRAHRLTLPLEDDILSLPSPGPDEAVMERELIELRLVVHGSFLRFASELAALRGPLARCLGAAVSEFTKVSC